MNLLYRDTLFRNSFYLIAATGVMAGFGFLFWIVNARLFTDADIGLATTLITVMNMIAILSLAGFNAAFIRFLPNAANKNDQMNTGLILVGIASMVLSGSFVLFVGSISPQLSFIRESPVIWLTFIAGCLMCALNLLTDSIFLADKQARYIFIIDAIFSFFKVLAPLFFIGTGAFGIFAAAMAAQALGTGLSIALMLRRFGYRPDLKVSWSVTREVWRYCASNYLAGILNLAPVTLVPILIINRLGAKPAAYFYIAMMIANLLYAIPFAATRSLFAEGSYDESSLAAQTLKAIRMMAILLVPSIAILCLAAGLILRVFGPEYADSARPFLELLSVSAIAVSAYSLVNAWFQVRKSVRSIMFVNIVYAGSIILLSYAWLPWGLFGIGLSWLVGNSIAAAAGYFLIRYGRLVSARWDNLTHERREIISCKLLFLRARLRDPSARKTMLFYPESPRIWHSLYVISHMLGYRIAKDPSRRSDIAVAFSDVTIRADDERLQAAARRTKMINARCGDISKEHVEQVFADVFGYGLSVDPETAHGAYVRKSSKNGVHDGAVFTQPQARESGYVYQRLIRNECGDGTVRDIRTTVVGGAIVVVLYRYKQLDDRFDSTIRAEFADVGEAFSASEQAQILRFCDRFGLDFGELDILRDNVDGRIYIVDANNTPSMPRRGVHMAAADYDRFIGLVVRAFAESFAAA